MNDIISKSILELDEELFKVKFDHESSGSTLCGVLIKDTTLICFYVGDSTCILINSAG